MAFLNKLGGLMKQTVMQNAGKVSSPYAFNAIRFSSTNKLFVGGLSFGTDDHSLRDAFTSFGDVTEARVINDRDTGRSRGFGFVSFGDSESASAALQAMDGQPLQGRNIRVSFANERQGPPRGNFGGGGGYGGGGGGYGGGGRFDDGGDNRF